MAKDNESANKEANLLCGDAIMNYRTVAGFGHEKLIIKNFDLLL